MPAALDKLVGWLREELGGKLPWRSVIASSMAGRTTARRSWSTTRARSARALHPAGAAAPAEQPRADPGCSGAAAGDAAGRLLRHRFPSRPSEVADRYAIPSSSTTEGVRRYGFHGLSYEYIADRLPRGRARDRRRTGGRRASRQRRLDVRDLCGQSVESTMGFTALDGLPMGTRPGQLDPGVVLYLMSEKSMSAKESSASSTTTAA